MTGFGLAVIMAFAFAVTNGLHDAANAIATLIATRGARPLPAVLVAAVCNMIGPLLLGAAVANTIATIVQVPTSQEVAVVGAGPTGAVTWNVMTWLRGLPASSSHALVGGLVGAALVAVGVSAVNWGGFDGWRPVGVWGVLIALADLAVPRVLGGIRAHARPAPPEPSDDARARPDPQGSMGNVGMARDQPRVERRAEGHRRGRRPAVRTRFDPLALGSRVGDARLRRGAHVRDRARRLDDRQDDRLAHHSACVRSTV